MFFIEGNFMFQVVEHMYHDLKHMCHVLKHVYHALKHRKGFEIEITMWTHTLLLN